MSARDSNGRALTAMRAKVASFGYHEVANGLTATGFESPGSAQFTLSEQLFSQHLDRIATGPVLPARISDVDLTQPGRHVFITFDDGGKSALYAGEELSRRGWRGHFFIISSLIGSRTFLSAAEMRELRVSGHVVASHSHSHPYIFREQSFERMVEEWRVSSDIVAQTLGERCDTASVPGGHISTTVLRSAGAAGLRHLFTSVPTLSPRHLDGCWILGRRLMKSRTSLDEVAELSNFRGWGRALLVRQLKDYVVRSVPSLYRAYVNRVTRTSHNTTECSSRG